MRVSIDGGGSTVPAPGSNTQVLFNDSGVIGASAGFTYVKGTTTATITNLLFTTANKLTLTPPATSATLTLADGKVVTVSNTLTFTGTDTSSVAFGTGGTVAYTANKLSIFAATTSAELAGIISDKVGSAGLSFSGISALANPSAALGLAAVNGVATTAMRSDAAPALDVSIAPTWTGMHTFASTKLKVGGSSSGTVTLAVPAAAGSNTLTLPAGTTDFSATGGTSQVVKQVSAGAALTVARLACADLSDAASGCSSSGTSFANPTASAGGTAVNGSASTAMRSDGAPALAAVQTRRVCSLIVGADNGVALVDADLGPQGQQCKVAAAATAQEIVVNADAGTPNVIVRKKHCATFAAGVCTSWTSTDLLSSALAAAASNFDACSNTGGTTGLDGGTTCSATLQNGTLAVGDWIELKSGTAGGTAKRLSVDIVYTIN